MDHADQPNQETFTKKVTQLLESRSSKHFIRKSAIFKMDQFSVPLKDLFKNEIKDRALQADRFFKDNILEHNQMSRMAAQEEATIAQTTELTTQIKYKKNKLAPIHQNLSDSDIDTSMNSCLPEIKAKNSIIQQIREREKEDQIKNANKSVHKTLIDLEKLAVDDKEMVELQRKTIYLQMLELQALQKQIRVVKRNLEAATNASKFMQDEICIVREDKVVLELNNKQLIEEKEFKFKSMEEEITSLNNNNQQLSAALKKMSAMNMKTSKANARVIKGIMDKHVMTSDEVTTQTDFEEDGESVYNLEQKLNVIYAKNTRKRVARLPLTQEEHELVLAQRQTTKEDQRGKAKKEQVESGDRKQSGEYFLEVRDTIGLKGRESTHMNIGIQVQLNNPHPHFKAVVEKSQRQEMKIQYCQNKITALKKEIEQKAKDESLNHFKAVEDLSSEMKKNQQVLTNFLLKEKEAQHAKVINQIKQEQTQVIEQRDQAVNEIKQYKKQFTELTIKLGFNRQIQPDLATNEVSINSVGQPNKDVTTVSQNDQTPAIDFVHFYKQLCQIGLQHIKNRQSQDIQQLDNILNQNSRNQPTFGQQKIFDVSSTEKLNQNKSVQNFDEQTATLKSNKNIMVTSEINTQTVSNSLANFFMANPDEDASVVLLSKQQPSGQVQQDEIRSESLMQSSLNTKLLQSRVSKSNANSGPYSLATTPRMVSIDTHQSQTPKDSLKNSKGKHSNKDILNLISKPQNEKNHRDDKTSFGIRDSLKSTHSNKALVITQSPVSQRSSQSKGRPMNTNQNDQMQSSRSRAANPQIKTVPLKDFEELDRLHQKLQKECYILQQELNQQTVINQNLRWEIRDLDTVTEEKIGKLVAKNEDLLRRIDVFNDSIHLAKARLDIEQGRYNELMKTYIEQEKEQKQEVLRLEEAEKVMRREVAQQQAIVVDKNNQIHEMLRQVEQMQRDHLKVQRDIQKENLRIKYEIADIKQLFEKKLKTEKHSLQEQMNYLQRNLAKLHVHISCLGCDQIKQDSFMLLCGHNICQGCLNTYSKTDHPRSSIRCEVCAIETKVSHLSISLPNRAICEEMTDIKTRVEHLFNYDIIGDEIAQELFGKRKKSSEQQIDE